MSLPEEYEPVVDWFAERMKTNLSRSSNIAKMHWKEDELDELFEKLLREVFELHHAMHVANRGNIQHEAVDVANFAMMIADWCRVR